MIEKGTHLGISDEDQRKEEFWMNGFLLVDKPKGLTSQDVVHRIKRKLNLGKCGHSGTLDPNTTGLLVIGCNQATKLMKLINAHDKVYETTIVFGMDSNTLDTSGTITEDFEMDICLSQVEEALHTLKGQKEQIPPMVSAIKVQGKKLYEYERNNQVVKLTPRPIEIYELVRLSDLRRVNGHFEIDLKLHCSKGFYVRSFARDLGVLLGGKALMKELRRTASGSFYITDATPLEAVTEEDIKPITSIFPDFEKLEVNDYIARLAKNGVMFDERQIKTENPFYVVHNHAIIALYEVVGPYQYKPLLIFDEKR